MLIYILFCGDFTNRRKEILAAYSSKKNLSDRLKEMFYKEDIEVGKELLNYYGLEYNEEVYKNFIEDFCSPEKVIENINKTDESGLYIEEVLLDTWNISS